MDKFAVIGMIATVVGAAASLIGGRASAEAQKKEIAKQVAEQITEMKK